MRILGLLLLSGMALAQTSAAPAPSNASNAGAEVKETKLVTIPAGSKIPLALKQRGTIAVGLFALSDVANDRGHKNIFADPNRAQRHINGELRSIFFSAE